MKHAVTISLFALLLMPGRLVLAWDECDVPRLFAVETSSPAAQFSDIFQFLPGSGAFPGLHSGELTFGGRDVPVTTTERVAEQQVRTETYYVVVVVNGRPVREARQREVVVTVYRNVQVQRAVPLPLVQGPWQSIDLCQLSWWNCVSVGPQGLVVGAGMTAGNQLTGVVVCAGISGLPSGVYYSQGSRAEFPG